MQSAMHIDVRDILFDTVGTAKSYEISDERLVLENLELSEPVNGEVTLTRLDEGIMLTGQVKTAVQLECHRCLRTFSRPLAVRLEQLYSERPQEDELPITQFKLDLAPAIRQELLLALPIKLVCGPDCPGIPADKSINKG
jgi:uncharacterized protein